MGRRSFGVLRADVGDGGRQVGLDLQVDHTRATAGHQLGVAVEHLRHRAVGHLLSCLEEDGAGAQLGDRAGVVAHEEDGAA